MYTLNLDVYSDTYSVARRRFREAAAAADATVDSYAHPERGPDGAVLATDVAVLGARSAPNRLVLSCGTHGVEGLPGSAALLDWLAHGGGDVVPQSTAVVLVHAINPFGMAWRQRQTNENVDLNRNFVDFATRCHPSSAVYEEVHGLLVDAKPDTPAWTQANEALAALKDRHGPAVVDAAILGGQHAHPDGLFYAGDSATWSHRTLLRVLHEHCRGAARVGMVDFHTGLGPYGYGMLGAADVTGSGGFDRAARWYGAQTVVRIRGLLDAADPIGASSPMGDLGGGVQAALAPTEVTYVALEVGTYNVDRFLEVYRANCWMQRHGSRTDALGERIASNFEQFFYPRFEDWKGMALARARQVVRQACAGLSDRA